MGSGFSQTSQTLCKVHGSRWSSTSRRGADRFGGWVALKKCVCIGFKMILVVGKKILNFLTLGTEMLI